MIASGWYVSDRRPRRSHWFDYREAWGPLAERMQPRCGFGGLYPSLEAIHPARPGWLACRSCVRLVALDLAKAGTLQPPKQAVTGSQLKEAVLNNFESNHAVFSAHYADLGLNDEQAHALALKDAQAILALAVKGLSNRGLFPFNRLDEEQP